MPKLYMPKRLLKKLYLKEPPGKRRRAVKRRRNEGDILVIVNPGLEVGPEDVVNRGKIEIEAEVSLSPKRGKTKVKIRRMRVERRRVIGRAVRRRARKGVAMRGRVGLAVGAEGIEGLNLL